MAADAITRNRSYIIGTRLPFSSASVLPAMLGGVWAWVNPSGSFHVPSTVTAALGVLFLHLAANTINDYYDWDTTDRINRFPTPFSGGSRSRLERVLSKQAFLYMAISFFVLSLLAGVVLAAMGRPLVLVMGTAGAFCGFLYSARPFSFQSRGVGELTIFLAFGPLITLGMGYAACGVFTLEFFLLGIPNGFLVANILLVNEFPDFEADFSSGKKNLVVRLGTSRARYGYVSILVLFYVSSVALVFMGLLPPWALAVVLTIPFAAGASRHLWKNHANPLTIVPAQAKTIVLQITAAVVIILSVALDKFI
jgi:1,4-dihydroxy-2-naphthoate octaprenyltransferase